ncbi:MAG TPA: hypothetical protein H9816_04010 [Candidatus Tidjanibacter faecipullorum]|uniref:Uncharacterized protein n=1 Tax=Candidatus Tidjanibacter faecipullorum TaxID=2838766 RepID=A0A9D2DDV9_9BACT|nr:hypothetical protein [Candidatus Tidjanibacter faecipullorum]
MNRFNIQQTERAKKKPEELQDICLLLHSIIDPKTPVDIYHDDAPDCTININNKTIGIEHTFCFAPNEQDYVASLNHLEGLFRSTLTNLDINSLIPIGTPIPNDYTITINADVFTQKHRSYNDAICQEFQDFIKHLYHKGTRPKMSYIQDVIATHSAWLDFKTPNDNQPLPRITINPSRSFLINHLPSWGQDYIMCRIKDKHDQYLNYEAKPKNSDIQEWWLCIAMPSYSIHDHTNYQLPKQFTSPYNKIYIVSHNCFSPTILKIYDANHSFSEQ